MKIHSLRSRLFPPCFLILAAGTPAFSQNIVTVTGHGEALLDAKDKKAAGEVALRRARDAARTDAVEQVIAKVYGRKELLGPKADEIILKVAQRSEGAIEERIEKVAEIRDGKAIAEISFLFNRQRIREQLEELHGISLTREAEGKLKVYVVAYTVEGMDSDRSNPVLLRDEVTDNRQNVQRSSFAGSRTDASTKAASSSASFQGSDSSSSSGENKQQSEGRFEGSSSVSGSYKESESASARAQAGRAKAGVDYESSSQGKIAADSKVKAGHSESGSQKWDNRTASAVDARSAQAIASSNYQQRSASGSSYNDTSTQFHSLKIYADTTKKGAGSTNELKGLLEEMLRNAGMDLNDLDDIRVVNKDFKSTEDLKGYLLRELKSRSDVPKDAFVAYAINSLTPVDTKGSQYSSTVSFHIRRIGDGYSLWNKETVGKSLGTSTSDTARLKATENALRQVGTHAGPELTTAIRKWQAEGANRIKVQEAEYLIQVNDAANPMVVSKLMTALRNAGLAPERSYDGAARSVTIKVLLNGKRGQDAKNAIDPLLDSFEFETEDASKTVLRVKK